MIPEKEILEKLENMTREQLKDLVHGQYKIIHIYDNMYDSIVKEKTRLMYLIVAILIFFSLLITYIV